MPPCTTPPANGLIPSVTHAAAWMHVASVSACRTAGSDASPVAGSVS